MSALDGRVAVVTGGGRGLGRAHALALAARGASVLVNDLGSTLEGAGADDAPAAETVAEIERLGGRAVFDMTDVASVDGGVRVVQRAIEAFGRVDIVINNAGFPGGGGDVEHPVDDGIDALMAVHFKAALGTMSAAFPDMATRRWGRIVNTVSEVALDARLAGSLGYGAAKAALWSATLAAARHGAPLGITVNAISPGARTRMSEQVLDAGFRGQPADLDLSPDHVARVVAWLVSDEAADVTGRVVHAAAGAVREYTTTRTSDSELVRRIMAAIPTG